MAVSVQIRERVAFQRDICTLIKDLDEQRETGELCDITLKLNGRCFNAHKAILAATSPYFRSMFTSCMKEKLTAEVDLTASLGLERPDSFRLILDYVYSGEIEININNAEDILRIADFLLFEDVKEYCRQFYLQHGNLNIKNCFCLSEIAEHHNLADVAHVAKKMFHARFHDYFVFSEEIYSLPDHIFMRMISDKELTHHTKDIDLIMLCLHWIRSDPYTRRNSVNLLWDAIDIVWLDREKMNSVDVITSICHKQDGELHKMLQVMKLLANQSNKLSDAIVSSSSLRESSAIISHSQSHPEKRETVKCSEDLCKILLASNCNSALKYTKIVLYDVEENCWRHLPRSESLVMAVPARLNVCNWVQHESEIYMFVSYNLPYPTDLLRINIVVMNIEKGEFVNHTFQHCYNTGECCKTSLTDDRSVPPAIVYCNQKICLIGNMEGTGQVFICDFEVQTYNCFQIPNTRFVSLARAVVKYDQYIYIWCRHRYGHEEFCINKDTSFVIFDIINKTFHDVPSPPGIGYGEYADPHALCLRGDEVIICSPGKPNLVLDESRNQWQKETNDIPSCLSLKMPVNLPYHGYELYTYSGSSLYMLQNPAAYTNSLVRLSPDNDTDIELCPPPLDGISLMTEASLGRSFVKQLPLCREYDDTYTKLIHSRTFPVEYDASGESSYTGYDTESEDGFEYDDFDYDDALYGYLDDFEF